MYEEVVVVYFKAATQHFCVDTEDKNKIYLPTPRLLLPKFFRW